MKKEKFDCSSKTVVSDGISKKEIIKQITQTILKEKDVNLPVKEFVKLVKETPLDNGMVDLEFEILDQVLFDKIKKIVEEKSMTIEEFFIESLTSVLDEHNLKAEH